MNFEAAASEAFQILRSFDYEVVLYDDEGKQVFEPDEARRFFAKPENLLVSIVDDGEDSSIRLYLSKSTEINSVMGLLSSLRAMATKYNMIFHVRKHGRVLSPKDFSTRAAVTESKDKTMKILEGMYGTSRSSYLKLENARMIVRHSSRINENTLGARGRNVEHIYIENGVGERHLFPTNHLAPARAMTHHVNNGGNWADEVGVQIARMAQDFANLAQASRHIYQCGNHLSEGAMDVRSKLRETLRTMRRTFECMCRKTRYDETVQGILEKATTLNENDDYTAQINELAALCNTEEKTLDESVLRTVAHALAEAKLAEDAAPSNTVKILGRVIDRSVWDDFIKNKNLELVSPVESGKDLPEFKTRTAQVGYFLRLVASKAKDDSMSNFLGWVSETLASATAPQLQKDLRRVAEYALHVAGVRFKSDVPKTQAVKEFAEWIDGFNTNRVLVENPIDPHSRLARQKDAIADEIADRFDEGEFLDYNDFDPEEPVSEADIVRGIEAYLDSMAFNDYDTTINNSANAQSLVRRAMEYMLSQGYKIVTDESVEPDMEDDTELSQEDVLLPSDQQQSLMGEIEPATVTDPDTGEERLPDDGYINRLQSLAGVKRR